MGSIGRTLSPSGGVAVSSCISKSRSTWSSLFVSMQSPSGDTCTPFVKLLNSGGAEGDRCCCWRNSLSAWNSSRARDPGACAKYEGAACCADASATSPCAVNASCCMLMSSPMPAPSCTPSCMSSPSTICCCCWCDRERKCVVISFSWLLSLISHTKAK